MKRFALALAIVFSSTALAFAAAPGDSGPETKSAKAAQAFKTDRTAKGRKAPAKAHASPAKDNAQEDARPGDITITGKAGSVTQISYGHGAKSAPVKAAGQ